MTQPVEALHLTKRYGRQTAVDELSFTVPAGARLVLTTVDTSPLGLFGGEVEVHMSDDSEGESQVTAGEALVLADVASQARTIEVALDVHGSVHWALAVEEPR